MNVELTASPASKGWICPQCGNAHGPHVDTCPAAGLKPVISHPPFSPPYFPPSYPGDWYPSGPIYEYFPAIFLGKTSDNSAN